MTPGHLSTVLYCCLLCKRNPEQNKHFTDTKIVLTCFATLHMTFKGSSHISSSVWSCAALKYLFLWMQQKWMPLIPEKNTVITTKYLALVFHATEWKRQNLVLLVPFQYAKAEVILQSKSYRNATRSAE